MSESKGQDESMEAMRQAKDDSEEEGLRESKNGTLGRYGLHTYDTSSVSVTWKAQHD